MNNENYGAQLERGRIETIENGGKYRVSSINRFGIVSLPIKAQFTEPLAVGDLVYFFLFSDGDGLIAAKM